MAESGPPIPPRQARGNSMDRPPLSFASSGGALSEELQCSICLDVITDPVSTPCGHNFCKVCLKTCWDTNPQYFCPYCKEKFSKKPDLKINTALRQIVEHFKETSKTKLEILCDMCNVKKLKALKLCLVCQISYCETHLEPHLRISNLKKHKLIDPVKNPKDYICQKHEKPLEVFCRDDKTCVCLLCAVTDHKTHKTVALEEESREKMPQLMRIQKDVQRMIDDRLNRIQDVKHSAELRKNISEKEKEDSVELFKDLIISIERCQSEMLEIMDYTQKTADKHDEDLIRDLEKEIAQLRFRKSGLENILNTQDHLHLLKVYPSLSYPMNTKNGPEISAPDTKLSVESLAKALTTLKNTLEGNLGMKKIQLYAVDVTLDPETASQFLILSADGKEVRYGGEQNYPDNPKRFDYCSSVLAKEGFSSGRFYFEVRVKNKTKWATGVARESVNRKTGVVLTPQNGYWTVVLRNEKQYSACDSPSVSLSLRVKPQVVGVFVDYEGGLVSFYDVESRSRIYSFTGQCFTGKLFPYFSPSNNDDGKNVAPLIISHSKLKNKYVNAS